MANFLARLDTFEANGWGFKEGNCSAINMAKAGFLCTTSSAVVCYYCNKELDGWEEDDHPWQEHKHHAGYCPFMKKYEEAPDPSKFTFREAIELERDRLFLKLNLSYEQSVSEVEKTFNGILRKGGKKETKKRKR